MGAAGGGGLTERLGPPRAPRGGWQRNGRPGKGVAARPPPRSAAVQCEERPARCEAPPSRSPAAPRGAGRRPE